MGGGVAATLRTRRFPRIRAHRLDVPDSDSDSDPARWFGPHRPPISEPGLELEPPAVLGRRVAAGVHGVSVARGVLMRGHSVS